MLKAFCVSLISDIGLSDSGRESVPGRKTSSGKDISVMLLARTYALGLIIKPPSICDMSWKKAGG